jgi:hypothetical protein
MQLLAYVFIQHTHYQFAMPTICSLLWKSTYLKSVICGICQRVPHMQTANRNAIVEAMHFCALMLPEQPQAQYIAPLKQLLPALRV